MFRATPYSLSGESITSIHYLVYVTLCGWLSIVPIGKELTDLHTRRSPTQSDIYQVLYWYNWFSWWWAQSCSKHVEKWNKWIRIVRHVGYLQKEKGHYVPKFRKNRCHRSDVLKGQTRGADDSIRPKSFEKKKSTEYLYCNSCLWSLGVGWMVTSREMGVSQYRCW
jgi:hypothetical protein